MGQSRPGRASSESGYGRYAPKAEVSSSISGCRYRTLRIDVVALGVIQAAESKHQNFPDLARFYFSADYRFCIEARARIKAVRQFARSPVLADDPVAQRNVAVLGTAFIVDATGSVRFSRT
jgi:hypothetical protein